MKIKRQHIFLTVPILIIGIFISILSNLPYKNGCSSYFDFIIPILFIVFLIYLGAITLWSIIEIFFKKGVKLFLSILASLTVSIILFLSLGEITNYVYQNSIEIKANLKSKKKEIPYYESVDLTLRKNNKYEIAKSKYKSGSCFEIGEYFISKDTIRLNRPKDTISQISSILILDSNQKIIRLKSSEERVDSEYYLDYKK